MEYLEYNHDIIVGTNIAIIKQKIEELIDRVDKSWCLYLSIMNNILWYGYANYKRYW